MKKAATIFLGLSLLTSCANMNGDYSKPWSKWISRAARTACSIVGVWVTFDLCHRLEHAGHINDDQQILIALIALLGSYPAVRWFEWFPQSGDHFKKAGRFVCKLTYGKSLKQIRETSEACLKSEIENLEDKIVRENARLQQQIYQKDLSIVQKEKFRHYKNVLASARKHTKNMLNAIEDEEPEDKLKECLRAFEKEMEEKKLS